MQRIQQISKHLATSESGKDYTVDANVVNGENDFDVLVIGGGIFGSWCAIELADRGCKVALVDSGEPGHEQGSSHGDGRIFRKAYTEDIYVDMMLASIPKWEQLQNRTNSKLWHWTGGVHIAKIGDSDSKELEEMYIKRGLTFERMTKEVAARRFPQFSVPVGHDLLYQKDYGTLFATKCVAACWKVAATTCSVFSKEFVTKINKISAGYEIKTSSGQTLKARKLVLAPGAWLSPMLREHFGMTVVTKVTAEVVSFFAANRATPGKSTIPSHMYTEMPVFITSIDNKLNPFGYYGLPQIEVPGVKLSAHYCGYEIADISKRPLSVRGGEVRIDAPQDDAARRSQEVIQSNCLIVSKLFPHLSRTPFRSDVCLYTSTSDHDFIISQIPGTEVYVAGGGSGHGFKHGPAVGMLIASLVLNEKPFVPVEKFSVTRPSLRESEDNHATLK